MDRGMAWTRRAGEHIDTSVVIVSLNAAARVSSLSRVEYLESVSAVSESTAGAGPLPTFSLAPRPQQVWAWPLMISNFDIDIH